MQRRASKQSTDMQSDVETNDWSSDIEVVLEQIRINSVILSKEHKAKYLYLKGILRYFRVPVILISSIASVSSVGLQTYIDQQLISAITCLLSHTCGIIGSIELFLAIQSRMENELMASKDYYILSIEIFKVLTLDRENRSIGGKTFLEASYGTYVKLIENSNVIDNKISDRLAYIDKSSKQMLPPKRSDQKGGDSDIGSGDGDSGGGSSDNISSPTPPTPSIEKKYTFFENAFFGKKNNDLLRMGSVDDMIGINMQKKLKKENPINKLKLDNPNKIKNIKKPDESANKDDFFMDFISQPPNFENIGILGDNLIDIDNVNIENIYP